MTKQDPAGPSQHGGRRMDSPLAAVATPRPAAGLSDRDQQILGFERQWWKYAGA